MLSDLGDQWHWKGVWRESPWRPSEWEHQSLPTGFLQGRCPGGHQDRQTPPAGISKVPCWTCREVGFPPWSWLQWGRSFDFRMWWHCVLRKWLLGMQEKSRGLAGMAGLLSGLAQGSEPLWPLRITARHPTSYSLHSSRSAAHECDVMVQPGPQIWNPYYPKLVGTF